MNHNKKNTVSNLRIIHILFWGFRVISNLIASQITHITTAPHSAIMNQKRAKFPCV